jgi:hypothetical protein
VTFTPEKDLEQHVRIVAIYADGSEDAFAVPQATLDQGPSAEGIAKIVAWEWQRDGYIKPGRIVGVRRPKQFAQN